MNNLLNGIVLTNASANLSNTTVTSPTAIGISAVRNAGSVGGSTANIGNKSVISGLQGGIAGNGFSVITLQDSTVQGTGATSFGARIAEGTLTATASTITGGQNGITLMSDPSVAGVVPSTITLNNTQVQGQTGSAIVVGALAQPEAAVANINISNGSTLLSGNNTVVDVRNGAAANVVVDASKLSGNVTVADGSTANVTLQNSASLVGDLQNVASATLTGNSTMIGNVTADPASVASLALDGGSMLTGQVNNVANFAISNQAVWQMTASQSVNNLALNGGQVRMGMGGGQQYFQLNVANLSGNGTFVMGTDYGRGVTDLLNVTGTANGNHQLLVSSTGTEPTTDAPIKVVQTVAGNAQFSLANGPADVGAFTYGLVKNGDDWFLTPTSEISTQTRTVLALFGTAPTVMYGEMASLINRMGDLRANDEQTGAWARTYGNRYDISNNAYGGGYTQNQYGLSMGVDTPVQIAGERVLLGVFAGYSKSDLDLSRGSSGEIGSTSLGMYGTWLGESGFYLDTLAKLNYFRNDAKVALSDGTTTKGNYNNLGGSASVEFGKHIELNNGYYVEPFTQWQAAVAQGKSFTLDNGLEANADVTRSLLGKAGLNFGRSMTLDNGSKLQPHLRVALVQEFVKSNDVEVNDNKFNNDLSGTRAEVGAGVSWTFNDRWQLHAELQRSTGDNVEQTVGGNVGVHYSF